MNTEERITRLEEAFTHLQEHVGQQDKVILELRESLDRMRREWDTLRRSARSETGQESPPFDERPPHY
ncbi:MAG: SlyX family protein [Opitutaceae bacterium]